MADREASEGLEAGTVFEGRFRIERLLGHGGMGAVYLARHEVLKQRLAIKLIHSELLGDRHVLRMFQREARAASRVRHPNVTAVYDHASTERGVPYIVMEYVEGTTLADFLLTAVAPGATLPLAVTLDLCAQVADGLAAAHECDVVHRDLKPTNIAVVTPSTGPAVKILDFGTAQLLGPGDSLATTGFDPKHTLFASPNYMAPELALGEPSSPAVDIYALGVIAYELLAGQLPFGGSPVDVVRQHVDGVPPPLPEHVPSSLAALVARCLAKDPAARPVSAAALAAEVRSQRFRQRTAPLHRFSAQVQPMGLRQALDLAGALRRGEAANLDATEVGALLELVDSTRDQGLADTDTVHLLCRVLEVSELLGAAEAHVRSLELRLAETEAQVTRSEGRLQQAMTLLEREARRCVASAGAAPPAIGEHISELATRSAAIVGSAQGALERLRSQLEEARTRERAHRDDIGELMALFTARLAPLASLRGQPDGLAALIREAGLS